MRIFCVRIFRAHKMVFISDFNCGLKEDSRVSERWNNSRLGPSRNLQWYFLLEISFNLHLFFYSKLVSLTCIHKINVKLTEFRTHWRNNWKTLICLKKLSHFFKSSKLWRVNLKLNLKLMLEPNYRLSNFANSVKSPDLSLLVL